MQENKSNEKIEKSQSLHKNSSLNNSIITDKDVLILKQLLEDGRKSSASISKEIDLGREIVNYRIKRLVKENLIVKFIPKINENAIHYQEYIILLKLNLEDEMTKEKFIKENIGNKYLIWTIKSDSGWDFIIRLYAEGVEEFKEKLSEILNNFSDVLANYYTIIASDKIKEDEKEILAKNLFDTKITSNDFHIIKLKDTITFDDKDKEILNLLGSDARVQYTEIAEKLDISSDTVKYRIDKMKSSGIIENFEPIINFNKLGLYQYAAIIKFNYLDTTSENKICEFLKKEKTITKAIKSVNSNEYFLNLVFEQDKQMEEFILKIKKLFENKIKLIEYFKID